MRNSLGAEPESSGSTDAGLRPASSDMTGFARPNAVTGDRVALRLPAVSAYLSVLRIATSGLAARMNFRLDEIEDLRIAVDEACVMLISAALPGANMEVEFVLAEQALEVAVTVPTVTGVQPATDTFSWTVLCALAEAVRSQVGSDNRVTIKLRKTRSVGGPAGESA